MKPESLEKLQAALSVLNSCTIHQAPDEKALAVIVGEGGRPDVAAPDEMARAVIEGYREAASPGVLAKLG